MLPRAGNGRLSSSGICALGGVVTVLLSLSRKMIPATADSMIVQGGDEDDMVYQNELKYKVVKNRLGGRVGHIGKWYFDARSLRIYDETEIDSWIADAIQSGDERLVYEGTQ